MPKKVKTKKPIKVSGSLSASQVMAQTIGINNRRPPYNYFLSGNVTISLYGWAVPLSYTFSNQQSQFQQPFNQFGMTPYYKWVKLYAGYTSMQFSNYTLNNHMFLGGGVQLTPGIFRFSAMYGRLYAPIREDTANNAIVPYYERMGMGLKAGIGKDNDYVDVIFFKADDNPNSIPDPVKQPVLPGQNAIVSVVASKQVLKHVVLSGEYAISAYTQDVRNASAPAPYNEAWRQMPGFNHKTSSSYSRAYNLKAQYSFNGLQAGIGYERIDPEYKTMGSYFFNTDFENYTANLGKTFLKGKINANGTFGLQRSNLNNDKLSTMVRNIYSLAVAYTASNRLTLNGSYSNFQSVSRVRSQWERITAVTPQDTVRLNSLDFVQTTQNLSATVAYTLTNPSSRVAKSALIANANVQDVGNAGTNNQRVSSGARFYNMVLSFNRVVYALGWNYTLSMNTNINQNADARSLAVGPTLNSSKTWFGKKLKTGGSVSWLNSYLSGYKVNDILNFRLNASYVLRTKHQFVLSGAAIHRINYSLPEARTVQPNFWELSLNSGYTYTF